MNLPFFFSICYKIFLLQCNYHPHNYDNVVDVLRRECKHVEMNLVPRPVFSLLWTSRQGKDKKGVTPSGGSTDVWSKVNPKLAATLMHFQREGVE